MQENREIIEKYLEYLLKVRGFSPKTVISYEHDLKLLESFLEKRNMTLSDMVFEDAREFDLLLHDSGYKSASINRIISGCRSFYHYLCANSYTEVQPFSRIGQAKQGRRLPSVLSDSEVKSLIYHEYSDYTSLMEVTMFNLFYCTGCRLQELLDMKIRDLDLKEHRAIVMGKGAKQRYVFLTERAEALISEYLPQRKDVLMALRKEDDGILLINKKGNKLPSSSVHAIFDKYRDELGITKKFTPHVFRHTFATRLLDKDTDIRMVQALLGHENIGTTQIYTHVSGARLEAVYRKTHPHAGRKDE
ncbi:MAG: tyrosine-type recombinase/integrase [Sphaerochaetaceae bacterium]|nr:tyrosine-type recombinase/integrase [Sphaerochaetaceae bacterium]